MAERGELGALGDEKVEARQRLARFRTRQGPCGAAGLCKPAPVLTASSAAHADLIIRTVRALRPLFEAAGSQFRARCAGPAAVARMTRLRCRSC